MWESRLILQRARTWWTVEGASPGPRGDLDRAQPVLPPQVHDLADQRLRGAVR